ncbi:MAG: hypothetical protein ISS79_10270 [Phycisphaerae bacterium]|nr:hypothetical protein [Phycisphaerae bacterium]
MPPRSQPEQWKAEHPANRRTREVRALLRNWIVVISERQFNLLAEEYKLSPTQRKLVRKLLGGLTEDRELTDAMNISRENVSCQFGRIFKKMHVRSRAQVLYTFISDAKSTDP